MIPTNPQRPGHRPLCASESMTFPSWLYTSFCSWTLPCPNPSLGTRRDVSPCRGTGSAPDSHPRQQRGCCVSISNLYVTQQPAGRSCDSLGGSASLQGTRGGAWGSPAPFCSHVFVLINKVMLTFAASPAPSHSERSVIYQPRQTPARGLRQGQHSGCCMPDAQACPVYATLELDVPSSHHPVAWFCRRENRSQRPE